MIISALLVTAAWQSMSQNSVDALRYSRIDIGGSARFMGLGGAFGALGADFTTSSTNPAGIGMFKTSEFLITPAIHTGAVESFYNGTTGQDSRTNFYLGNVGIILASKTKSDPKKPGWRAFSFATGMNRLNDFNYRYEMAGTNNANSMLDTYVDNANGIPFSDIEEDPYGDYAFDLNLAWWAYLLDLKYPNVDNQYVSPVAPGSGKYQYKQIDSWGSMNEYVFTMGANYNDRLYLGLTFGIPMIRYYESSLYEESGITNSDLKYFQRFEDLETHGSGFNLKFGFIYRASDWLRVGASFHTPSWFGNMTDYYTSTMISEFYTADLDGNYTYVENSPSGSYDYNLTTPYRAQGSVGIIVGTAGLISAEYEYADYAYSSFDAYDYSFRDENNAISSSYKGGHHVRVGTEWRYNIFSFRAGGKYFTSPYNNDINDGSRWGFSAGAGLRQKWFFMDVAYAFSKMEEDYYLYSSPNVWVNPVLNTSRVHSVLVTLGVKL